MDAQELDFRYKEMVRLSNILEQYSKSSFEDVKLLGSIGALLAFKPASSLLGIQDGLFLIVGFLAI